MLHHCVIAVTAVLLALTSTSVGVDAQSCAHTFDGVSYDLSSLKGKVFTVPTVDYTYVFTLCGNIPKDSAQWGTCGGSACQFDSTGKRVSVLSVWEESSPPKWLLVAATAAAATDPAAKDLELVFNNGDDCSNPTAPRITKFLFKCQANIKAPTVFVTPDADGGVCSPKGGYVFTIAGPAVCPHKPATPPPTPLLPGAAACNFGPTHHSHLVLPRAKTEADCSKPSALFVLSHGATFFCPHGYDVKVLATIQQDAARALLCKTYFQSIAAGVSAKMVLRPNLEAGGLVDEAEGRLRTWSSPYLYHVHSFGHDNSAGPPPGDTGWDVTTLLSKDDPPTVVNIVQVLYGRKLNVQPSPPVLTYLLHSTATSTEPNAALALPVITHYISTSGPSGFDQVGTVALTRSTDKAAPLPTLRTEWPTFLTVPSRTDSLANRLTVGQVEVDALLHLYDDHGLPATLAVTVTMANDYYAGASDGFAGYGTMCPIPLPHPQSPAMCHPSSQRSKDAVTMTAPAHLCSGGGEVGVDVVKYVAIAVACLAVLVVLWQNVIRPKKSKDSSYMLSEEAY